MGGIAAQLGRKLIGSKHSRHDCSVLQWSFQNYSKRSTSLQGTDSLVDRRQLFVSLDRIDNEIRDGSFSHRFDAFETKQPCGAGSQTCAATALVRRVYLPGYVSTSLKVPHPILGISASDCSHTCQFLGPSAVPCATLASSRLHDEST